MNFDSIKEAWSGWSLKKKILVIVAGLIVVGGLASKKNEQTTSSVETSKINKTSSALDYVQDKKWSLDAVPCDTNGGSYFIYTKDRGMVQIAGGVEQAAPKSDAAPMTFEYLDSSPNGFTYKQTYYANSMVSRLLNDSNAVAGQIEKQVILVDNNKITYHNKVSQLNFDKLMKGMKEYDVSEEDGFGNLCK